MRQKIFEFIKSVTTSVGFAFKIVPKESSILLLLYILAALIPFLGSFYFGRLIDELNLVINKGGAASNAIKILLLYGAVSAIPSVVSSFRSFIEKKWEFGFQTYMEIFVLRKRVEIDIATYEDPKFQDLLQRAFRQAFWPILRLSDSVISSIFSIATLIVGSIIAASLSWKIYAIVILTSIPRFYTEFKYGYNVWSIWQKDSQEQRRFADLRSYFMGRNAIAQTKLFQSGAWLLNWASKILRDFNAKHLENEKSRLYRMSLTHLLSTAGLMFSVYLIVIDVTRGLLMIGSMVFMLTVIEKIRSSISDILSGAARQYEQHLIVKDLITFFETKPLIASPKNPKRLDLETAPIITFENVGFKYPGSDKWSLKNINLSLMPGEKIGLVGNNGAGKTTLVRLICRIYDPTEGRILVNGIDLRELDLDEWTSHVSYMSQKYISYDFKVKDAIAIGRTQNKIDLDKVEKAAKMALADSFIQEYPNKYNQPLGVEFDEGKEPSAGQNQRLEIARHFYRDAAVAIFDEPTASVDAESEEKIFESLLDLSKKTLAIMISHNFSTIQRCNTIVVLDNGKIKELGTHKELMKSGGMYKKMYELQASRFDHSNKTKVTR